MGNQFADYKKRTEIILQIQLFPSLNLFYHCFMQLILVYYN